MAQGKRSKNRLRRETAPVDAAIVGIVDDGAGLE